MLSRKYNIFYLFVCFTFCLFSTEKIYARQGIKTLSIVGSAYIGSQGTPEARDDAISEALTSAIETAVSEILPLELFAVDFPTINEIIFQNTRDFIQRYKTLTEMQYGRKYKALVQVSVLTDKIAEKLADAGITPGKKNLPKVLFFITENLSGSSPKYWWAKNSSNFISSAENAMSKTLRVSGFPIAYHKLLPSGLSLNQVMGSPYIQAEQAVEIGKKMEADVIVIGTSEAEKSNNAIGGDLKPYRGTVKATAFIVNTGEELGYSEKTVFATNSNDYRGRSEAIAKAGTIAAKDLGVIISEAWERHSGQTDSIKITISGTQNLAYLVELREFLNKMNNVTGIWTKEMQTNEAILYINYNEGGKKLADVLIYKDFKSFGVNITEIADNALKIALIPVRRGRNIQFKDEAVR